MDRVYIYEGDFMSLLNMLGYLLKNNLKPDKIKDESYSPTLLEQTINLAVKKEELIVEQIARRIGVYSFSLMYDVYLSEEENKELILYYFLKNALKYCSNVLYYRNLKCVSEVLRISNYVRHEAHKMKGFLRFRELEKKVLYAEMEPTNDILFLVSKHFTERLKNEFWIIKDKKRRILSIYDKKQFVIVLEEDFQLILRESEEEEKIEALWKAFYKTIGIKERKNERCRRNFMPKKYWKYITEVKDEL